MKAKRIVIFLLSLSLMLSMLSGCSGGTKTKDKQDEFSTQSYEQSSSKETEVLIPTNEYERAVWYGFLPDELLSLDSNNTEPM